MSERSGKDRHTAPAAASSPAPATAPAGLAFLPFLFGRRASSKVSTPSKSLASASVSMPRTSLDETTLLSPRAAAAALPGTTPVKPFDLESALALMEPGATRTVAELCEIVKATSVWLANLIFEKGGDLTAPIELAEDEISAAAIRTLYAHAFEFGDPKADYLLRTAAIRLLAVLVAAAPPQRSILEPSQIDLPASISPRTVYRLVTAASGGKPGSAQNNQMFVEIGALKALSRDGAHVEGMDGIVGWLLQSLAGLKVDWLAWCSLKEDAPVMEDDERDKPFGPIRSASPAATASSVVDLTAAIVQHHIALFSPGDLSLIVKPMLEFIWTGILASVAEPPRRTQSTSRTRSPNSSSHKGDVRRASSMTVSRLESSHSASPRIHHKAYTTPGMNTTNATPSLSSSLLGSPASHSAHAYAVAPQVKWARTFKSLCSFIEMLLENTTINDDLFDEIFEMLCLAFGQDDHDAMIDIPEAWGAANELTRTMLSAKSGRRGELAIRKALEGKLVVSKISGRKSPDVERKVTRGAVIVVRQCTLDRSFTTSSVSLQALSFSSLSPSLVAAQSTSRFPGTNRVADWSRWQAVDVEILALLDNHLSNIEFGNDDDAMMDDAWTEGGAACEVLDGMLPLVQSVTPEPSRTLLKGGHESAIIATFSSILLRLPRAIGRFNTRLHTSTVTSPSQSSAGSTSFYHPKYIDLLLELSVYLDDDLAGIIIDHYQRECLCLPFTSGWIKNVWRLLEAFCMSYDLVVTRVRVSTLLYHDIYGYVEDLPEHRAQLVEHVMVPYLEKWLPDESDEEFLNEALGVLVSAAVAETMQIDDDRRRVRSTKDRSEVEEEDASALPSKEVTDAASGGSFDAIRRLIVKLATETQCKGAAVHHTQSLASIQSSTVTESSRDSREGRAREPPTAQSGLRNIMNTLSPSMRATEMTPSSTLSSATINGAGDEVTSPVSLSPVPTSSAPHMTCKSLRAVSSLIAIFTRLSFSPPQSLTSGTKAARTPASSRGITIYRDLLNLLFPMADGSAAQVALAKVPARCPRARIVILQWLTRFRADRKHRIFLRADINRFVISFAATLFRTRETEEAVRSAMEQEEARRRARLQQTTGQLNQRGDDERGRSARVGEASTHSRSRSKAAAPIMRAPTVGTEPQVYNPLWCLPETLSFEVPADMQPSEGMTTYDPNHPSLRDKDAPAVEGVWLPVSEYVRVLNGLLRWEHDWEIVSYVLCFLPQQLGNKYFFHGRRATREIKALLQVLCDGILAKENRWERRFHVPSFIKRTHINAAAYQAISILISYRGVFERAECGLLVESLVAGLEGNAILAKPSLQALTICVFELELDVSRHLLSIIQKMQQILSTPAVAVHILEFLIALGSSNLYRNFTEDQYRLVFAVAIGYIAEHNARSDQPIDFANSREAFTLSQHVIGLAFHTIYLWFLALKVTQRPQHVSELVRGLLHAKTQRVINDERTEVCFDWLARYTYGNADPKPATSFLSEVVMSDHREAQAPKIQSWLLGGAIVTISSHQRSGWATISTTRPTGSTAIVCKLENVPFLEIGETNADLISLPAVLMANRERKRDVNEEPKATPQSSPAITQDEGEVASPSASASGTATPALAPVTDAIDGASSATVDPHLIVSVKSAPPPLTNFDQSSQQGFVWSGATPSQRRKDVMVEPSYLALQLLSSYPNANLDTPRGRLIPREGKFERALRGIDNTPVINTFKIAVLYVGPGQQTETEIFANVDGSPLYLDFLAGLGRIIRLKGQVDVFTGGLDRENDTDGAYAYAWWDDLAQMIFHAPTMMPNLAHEKEFGNKKRLVGNDYVKIVYNESGHDFAFDTIKTSFNFVNIVISPHATRDVADAGSLMRVSEDLGGGGNKPVVDEWGGDSEDFFKVVLQRAPGIPDFSPIGEHKLVSRRNLPILVRQMAHYANSIAVRFQHIRVASDAASAEYITIWRARLQAIKRLRDMLPPPDVPDPKDPQASEEMLRDFTRVFSQRLAGE